MSCPVAADKNVMHIARQAATSTILRQDSHLAHLAHVAYFSGALDRTKCTERKKECTLCFCALPCTQPFDNAVETVEIEG